MFTRRQMLKVGAFGAGLTLSDYLRMTAAAGAHQDNGRSAILVFLRGGPAHQDTFDLKPNAPAEYRGEFRPIKTVSPGVEICEHLPRLAQRADRYAVIRGITHNLAAHNLGVRYLMTGNRPTPVVQHPMYGCVTSHEFPPLKICRRLSRSTKRWKVRATLERSMVRSRQERNLATVSRSESAVSRWTMGLSIERYRRRRSLLADLDHAFEGFESLDEPVRGLDRFSEQAYRIISSQRARDAFELSREPEQEMDRFGKHEFGQSMLLAVRLVEAGVRFVTVLLDGWDTHADNFNTLGRDLLPRFDQSLSALLDRLQEKARLDSTAIFVTGEFGRTPKVNDRSGRDHWARAMCSLMAGGDINGGQVIGETDDKAQGPENDGFTPDDVAATFFQNIGIDPTIEYEANTGRPITLIRDGEPIRDLFR